MRRTTQMMIGIPLLILGLGSSLILQKGYAQTPDSEPLVVEHELQMIQVANPIQLNPQSEQAVMRLAVQTTPETSQPGKNEALRTVSVSGSGEVSARPDQATVRLGVQTEAETATAALTQNSTQTQNVLAAIEEAGIAAEDIRTQALQLQPRYSDQPATNPRVIGYVAANIIEIRARNLANLGQLLDVAVQAGANTVDGIYFEIADPAILLDQAREAAMGQARHKAEQLAALANAELGEVMTLNEVSLAPPPVVQGRAAASTADVPVQPGTQTVRLDVQVTWLLR